MKTWKAGWKKNLTSIFYVDGFLCVLFC